MAKSKRTNRSPQSPKSRSVETRALIMSHRGGTQDKIPSGKAYKKWDGKYDA